MLSLTLTMKAVSFLFRSFSDVDLMTEVNEGKLEQVEKLVKLYYFIIMPLKPVKDCGSATLHHNRIKNHRLYSIAS